MPKLERRITKRVVEALALPARGQPIYWDAELPAFGVRVSPGGTRTFLVDYFVGGRRRRRSLGRFGRVTVEQARREAQRVLGEAARGIDALEGNRKAVCPTLREFVETEAMPEFRATRKAWRNYRAALIHHLLPALGEKRLDEIRAEDVLRFRRQWMEGPKRPAPATVNRVLEVLRVVLNMARRQRLIHENIFADIKMLKVNNARTRYLKQEELGRLLAVLDELPADEEWLAFLVRMLLTTGMRVGEALGLSWDEIHLDLCEIHLPDAKAGQRVVKMAPQLARELEVVRSRRSSHWVFPHSRDQTRPRANIWYPMWKRILEQAEISDFRVHDLRHTAATYARLAGADLPTLGRMLGHRTLRMTQRYAHVTDRELERTVDAVAAMVDRAGARRAESVEGAAE